MKGFFVTGTDTNIGKTITSAVIIVGLQQRGYKVGYFKPLQSGAVVCDDVLVSPDVEMVRQLTGLSPEFSVSSYCFTASLAPYEAARCENKIINENKIMQQYQQLVATCDVVIVEGAGGIKVPYYHDVWVDDFIVKLGLPAIIVGRPGLGTINHTLLTIDALLQRNVVIAGFLFCDTHLSVDVSDSLRNHEIISEKSAVAFLGEIPVFSLVNGISAAVLNAVDWEKVSSMLY